MVVLRSFDSVLMMIRLNFELSSAISSHLIENSRPTSGTHSIFLSGTVVQVQTFKPVPINMCGAMAGFG